MKRVSYETVLVIDCRPEFLWSFGFGEAYFKVTVETEYESCYAYELNEMCDAHNYLTYKTGRQRITVVGTDPYHNQNDDLEPFSVVLKDELAREVVRNILDDEKDLLWFTKDRLSYAEKTGTAI